MASTQRSSWILFHFFVLFVVSYAVGVLFLHITVSLCKYKVTNMEGVFYCLPILKDHFTREY